MPTLLKNGSVAHDPWTQLADDSAIPDQGMVLVSLDRWQKDRDALIESGLTLGLQLDAGEHPDSIADDIGLFDMIALVFPAFSDGRAYSYARLLRERHDFVGELRAVGDVLQDQFMYMHRCGFDAFEVKKEADVIAFADALTIVSSAYQPALDDRRIRGRDASNRMAA